MGYITAIKTAIFVFPIIAFLFTIPFILHQYHKYGSINKLRVLIIYSFILYMISVYFLVILPLPNRAEVTKGYLEMIQLKPFSFVIDFINETSLVLTNPSTYITALKQPCFYIVVFNIFMTIPFGMYLRYYFKCDFKKVFFWSFLLSLFFELTQLSGLYFIYPGPYRLFDVDDLILNTTGGILGYFIMGLFKRFLPSREEIDEDALEEGKKVSGLRRITTFCLDAFIYLIFCLIINIFFKASYVGIICFAIYYGILPVLLKGRTIGSAFLNVKCDFPDHLFLRILLKNAFLYVYYLVLPFGLILGAFLGVQFLELGPTLSIWLYFTILVILFFFYVINILVLLIKGRIYYDYIFKVVYKSTIE